MRSIQHGVNALMTALGVKVSALCADDGTAVVQVAMRTIIDQRVITAPATTGVTLASLYTGGVLPVGAVTGEIQADGGIVKIGLTATLVTPATGYRLDDGMSKTVDSLLSNVTVVGKTVAVPLNVTLYDRA